MLTWLRDSAKIFLIITIVVFVSLIFLRWGMGTGGGKSKNPYDRPVATVNGTEILPADYSNSFQEYNNRYRYMLENSGNPDPDAMLLVMSRQIDEEAFDGMIDSYLEQDYLQTVDFPEFTYDQTESLILANASAQPLEGMTPEEYVEMFASENPAAYQQYLYQLFALGNSLRFPIASELIGMSSREEIRFLLLNEKGTITARYITFDEAAMIPAEQDMISFYEDNVDLFIDVPGTLLRYVTIQVQPAPTDYVRASEVVDSLAYAVAGRPVTATREQLIRTFDVVPNLVIGTKTTPTLAASFDYPTFDSYHVLMLDSINTCIPETPDDTLAYLQDTLFMTHWEQIVLPGSGTVNNILWTLEQESEKILANSIPEIADSLLVIDFGEMKIDENTVVGEFEGIVSEELMVYAKDTIWRDSIGPVFFHPYFKGGLHAFTIVRKLDEYEADTTTIEEARQSGELLQLAINDARRQNSFEAATAAFEFIRDADISLGAYAEAESIHISTTRPFTALEIKNTSPQNPNTAGILNSTDFAEQALVAPEFTVIGPFRIGEQYVLAEVLSRQPSPEDPTHTAIVYAFVQNSHTSLTGEHIIRDLTESGDVVDLREQWSEYATTFEDSIRNEEERLEE